MDKIDFRDSKLKELYEKIVQTNNTSIRMQIIMRKENEENKYIWYVEEAKITDSLAADMQETFRNYFERCMDSEVKDFDISNNQSDDYLVEEISSDLVPALNKVIVEMQREDNKIIIPKKLAHSTYLKGFAITFSPDIVIFNKVTKINLLQLQKYLAIIPSSNGEFTSFDEQNVLSIPKNIDAILYKSSLFVFNRNNFIELFKFNDVFDDFIDKAKSSLNKLINDPIMLMDNIGNDTRKYRRLASACAGFVDRIVSNNIKLQPIAKAYNFKISFVGDLIDVENSKINDILKLINAQAVKDEIFGDKYIAQEKTKI